MKGLVKLSLGICLTDFCYSVKQVPCITYTFRFIRVNGRPTSIKTNSETRKKRYKIVNKMNSSFSASGRTFVSLFCNFKVHRLILSAVHAILNVESNPSLKGNLFNSPSISRI